MKKRIAIILITLLTGTCFVYLNLNLTQKQAVAASAPKIINTATFSCSHNKTIRAIFFANQVDLTLSDGRHLLLPQALSASGALYANADEAVVFWNKGNTAFIEEGPQTTFAGCVLAIPEQTQMANPASVNCSKSGGHLVIEKRGDGGEYGLCYFEDNKACEEWALLRGECPIGGVSTTGFDTIEQKYCVWLGGKTLAVPKAVCTFKNGSTCSTETFYKGSCSPKRN